MTSNRQKSHRKSRSRATLMSFLQWDTLHFDSEENEDKNIETYSKIDIDPPIIPPLPTLDFSIYLNRTEDEVQERRPDSIIQDSKDSDNEHDFSNETTRENFDNGTFVTIENPEQYCENMNENDEKHKSIARLNGNEKYYEINSLKDLENEQQTIISIQRPQTVYCRESLETLVSASTNSNETDCSATQTLTMTRRRPKKKINFGMIPKNRIKVLERKFHTNTTEDLIKDFQKRMLDKDLAQLFENCFSDTLDKAIIWYNESADHPKTYVIPGNSKAMYIRDSTIQFLPYVEYASKDDRLKNLILGVILLQAEYLSKDIYSNAFYPPEEANLTWVNNPWIDNPWINNPDSVFPQPSSSVWQSKWGADNVAAFIKLTYHYWKYTKDESFLENKSWRDAVDLSLKTFERQRNGTLDELDHEAYTFTRETRNASESLILDGRGVPVRNIGLVKSQFRPSDDAAQFPFVVATNAMIYTELIHLQELFEGRDSLNVYEKAGDLANKIHQSILDNAAIQHEKFGEVLAYEIDGYGSYHFMDDATIPNLLSLPYLGFLDYNDKLYQSTRSLVLGRNNKYWFKCGNLSGTGSPHSGMGYIWPMSLSMTILTSTDDKEILRNLELLKLIGAKTGLLPQAVSCNDLNQTTEDWFTSSNSLFAEAILKLSKEKSYILFGNPPQPLPPQPLPNPTIPQSSNMLTHNLIHLVGLLLISICIGSIYFELVKRWKKR
ncbi:hypothetical protein G9A89_003780 [Geosiphon pyriformis]|nr:hypothetical protein G9A89_003780 [Geosiphon pyriformis]